MKRAALIIIALLVLQGCGLAQPKSGRYAGGASPAPLIPASPNGPSAPARCDAASLAYLVGKSRSAIPVAVDPSRRRVTCSNCPVADDFRADRTNILFDAQTGVVLSVNCG
jgi:hypothetical protein